MKAKIFTETKEIEIEMEHAEVLLGAADYEPGDVLATYEDKTKEVSANHTYWLTDKQLERCLSEKKLIG